MQKQSHHIIYRRLVLAMIAVAVMAAGVVYLFTYINKVKQ